MEDTNGDRPHLRICGGGDFVPDDVGIGSTSHIRSCVHVRIFALEFQNFLVCAPCRRVARIPLVAVSFFTTGVQVSETSFSNA